MSDRTTTRELLERLQRHYIKPGDLPGGIFVPECGWYGVGGTSRCDALYVGFTSTSGRRLIGHELKVSRADWRHELNQAGKADPWHDQCHAWYVVAPSVDIVPPEEVPPGWGLMVINPRTKTRLDIKVKAQVRVEHTPSWDAVRSIMARQDTLRAQEIHRARVDVQLRERDVEREKKRLAQVGERSLSAEDRTRLDMMRRLEESFGVEVKSWVHDDERAATPEQLGAALRVVQAAAAASSRNDRYAVDALRQSAQTMLNGLASFGEAVEALRELSGGRS